MIICQLWQVTSISDCDTLDIGAAFIEIENVF